MESIPPAYVSWRAGTITLFLAPLDCLKIPALATQPGGIGSLESILGLCTHLTEGRYQGKGLVKKGDAIKLLSPVFFLESSLNYDLHFKN